MFNPRPLGLRSTRLPAALALALVLGTLVSNSLAQQRVITRQRNLQESRQHTLQHQRVYQHPDRLRVHRAYDPSWRPYFERHYRAQTMYQQRLSNARMSPPRPQTHAVNESVYRVRQDNPNRTETRYRTAPPVERPAVDPVESEPREPTEATPELEPEESDAPAAPPATDDAEAEAEAEAEAGQDADTVTR